MISSDSSGRFIIIWGQIRFKNNDTELFGQSYNKFGIKNGINFRLDNSNTGIYGRVLDLRKDGYYVAGWNQASYSFFRRFDTLNNSIGNPRLVSNDLQYEKLYSDVKIFENKIISVWLDPRYGSYDIFCNIRSFSNPDTTVNINFTSNIIPSDFKLYQNIPNPFNPSTKIRFEIPKATHTKLYVFDALGRIVANLVDEQLQSGIYETEFDGSNLTSGVYFCKLESESFSETKKLLLLK
jgi:hypothetical protein